MNSTLAKFSPLTALLAMPLLCVAAAGIDSNGLPAPIHVVNSSPAFTPRAGYSGDKTLLFGPYLLSPVTPSARPATQGTLMLGRANLKNHGVTSVDRNATQGTLTLGRANPLTIGASPAFSSRAAPAGETKPRREPSPARPKMLPPANSDIFRFDAKLPALSIPLLQRPTYTAPKPNLD